MEAAVGLILPGSYSLFSTNYTTITTGQSAILTWTTTNATAVSINQGIGTVAVSGTKTVTPAVTTTYILTVTGSGGTVTQTVTVAVGSATVVESSFKWRRPSSARHGRGARPGVGGFDFGRHGVVCHAGRDAQGLYFRRSVLSYGYLSFSQVVPANAADEAFNVRIARLFLPWTAKLSAQTDNSYAVKGTCYLITGGKRAAFTSAAVFTGLGFSFKHTTTGDVSF